jgi:hypothetical protein
MFGRKKKEEEKEPDPFNVSVPFVQMIPIGVVGVLLEEAFDWNFGTFVIFNGCGIACLQLWKIRTKVNEFEEGATAARKEIQVEYDAHAAKVVASQANVATYASNERRIAELKRELQMALQQEEFLTAQFNNR